MSVEDSQGREVAQLSKASLIFPSASASPAEPTLSLWAEPPYATFEPMQLFPDRLMGRAVEIRNLYRNEVDQAALIVAPYCKEPLRARVTVSPPAAADKTPFGGTLTLREVVQTGTVNGELAADALPALGDAGLITLLPHRAAKIWVSVDAHGANPGVYEGQITVQPLAGTPAAKTIPLRVEVLDLALDKQFPLALCTWDYVPNNWFPDQTEAVLDDMMRHGVNIWPRSDCIPSAKLGADGKLAFDWSKLDVATRPFQGPGEDPFPGEHTADCVSPRPRSLTRSTPPNWTICRKLARPPPRAWLGLRRLRVLSARRAGAGSRQESVYSGRRGKTFPRGRSEVPRLYRSGVRPLLGRFPED